MGAVAVDLDNTLTDRPTMFRSWVTTFIDHHAITDEDAVAYLAELDADGFADKRQVFMAVRQRWQLDSQVHELIEQFYEGMLDALAEAPDARWGLTALRDAGHDILVVTNGSPRQWDKIDRMDLRSLVDGIAVSSTTGARKPDPAIFEAAADDAGISVGDIEWMVGDNPEADIGGAHNLDIGSVWLRRGRTWPHHNFRPTVTVDSFGEAVKAVLQ